MEQNAKQQARPDRDPVPAETRIGPSAGPDSAPLLNNDPTSPRPPHRPSHKRDDNDHSPIRYHKRRAIPGVTTGRVYNA